MYFAQLTVALFPDETVQNKKPHYVLYELIFRQDSHSRQLFNQKYLFLCWIRQCKRTWHKTFELTSAVKSWLGLKIVLVNCQDSFNSVIEVIIHGFFNFWHIIGQAEEYT